MAWGRMDDGFDDHPKILALLEEDQGVAAVGLWTLCWTWALRNTRKKGKIPGAIPSGLPRRYAGPAGRDLAKLLVARGLWEETEDGWQIHDFADYLPTDEVRAARSAAGKRGAEARWRNKQEAEATNDEASAKQPDSNLPSPSHDDASDAVANDGSRAHARRAISSSNEEEIAPIPEPNPEPPRAHARGTPSANALLDEHLAACRPRPNRTVVAQTGDAIDTLLDDPDVTADMIRAGLALMRARPRVGPGLLANLVDEARRTAAEPGNSRASPGHRPPHQPYKNPAAADYEKGFFD